MPKMHKNPIKDGFIYEIFYATLNQNYNIIFMFLFWANTKRTLKSASFNLRYYFFRKY